MESVSSFCFRCSRGKQSPVVQSRPKSYSEVKALPPAAPVRPQQTHVTPVARGDIPTDALHLQSEREIESLLLATPIPPTDLTGFLGQRGILMEWVMKSMIRQGAHREMRRTIWWGNKRGAHLQQWSRNYFHISCDSGLRWLCGRRKLVVRSAARSSTQRATSKLLSGEAITVKMQMAMKAETAVAMVAC